MNTTPHNTSKSTTLAIEGMFCSRCVQSVTKALASVPGVQTKAVNVGSATIIAADPKAAIAAIADAGFEANVSDEPPAASSCSGCGR